MTRCSPCSPDTATLLERIGPEAPVEIVAAAHGAWEAVLRDAPRHGVRNAQTTLIPPTGTVSLMLDCETTGIEPYYALAGHKRFADGGRDALRQPRARRRAAGARLLDPRRRAAQLVRSRSRPSRRRARTAARRWRRRANRQRTRPGRCRWAPADGRGGAAAGQRWRLKDAQHPLRRDRREHRVRSSSKPGGWA